MADYKKSSVHCHSTMCDGKNTLQDMASAACAQGLTTLGFTGHSYTQRDREYCMSPSRTAQYKATIAKLKAEYKGKVDILCGNAVQPLGSQRVDLIEGQRPQTHRYAAESVLNVARAVQDMVLTAQNNVGVFGVDVEQNGADGRELLPQRGAKLLCVGQLCPGAYQTHHDLSAVRAAPQEDVPYQPLAALLVVRADALLCKKGAQRIADLVQHAGLQLAVRAGDDAVGTSGVRGSS